MYIYIYTYIYIYIYLYIYKKYIYKSFVMFLKCDRSLKSIYFFYFIFLCVFSLFLVTLQLIGLCWQINIMVIFYFTFIIVKLKFSIN